MDFYNFILPGRKYINGNYDNIVYIPVYKQRKANLSYSVLSQLESQIIQKQKFKNEYDYIKNCYESSIDKDSWLSISNSNHYSEITKIYPNYIQNKDEESKILKLTHLNIFKNLKKSSIKDPFSMKSKLFLNINKDKVVYSIPCLFESFNKNCNDIILYFHGNSECIFDIENICQRLGLYTHINVLAIEYPGYSIYNGDPSEEKIYLDSIEIYDYLKSININNIYAIGRSIGTGIAIYLSSKRNICKLMLISPFLSIRNIVEDLTFFLLKYLVKERFKNEEMIKFVKCPILLIHGEKDKLIPIRHSINLKKIYDSSPNNLSQNKFSILKKFPNMTHNLESIENNIIYPFIEFIKK